MKRETQTKLVGAATAVVSQAASQLVSQTNPALAALLAAAPQLAEIFLEKARAYVEQTRKSRLANALAPLVLDSADPAASADRVLTGATAFSLETIHRLLDDVEEKKAWAYGALLRAFDLGLIDEAQRPRWLRFVADCFDDDLVALLHNAELANVLSSMVTKRNEAGVDGEAVFNAEMEAHVRAAYGRMPPLPIRLSDGIYDAWLQDCARDALSRPQLDRALHSMAWFTSYNRLAENVTHDFRLVFREGAATRGLALPREEDVPALVVARYAQGQTQDESGT